MIDKNGKLFGFINIIDLFIVLVVVLAVVFVGKKLVGGTSTGGTVQDVELTFYVEEVPTYVAQYVKEDARVEDEGKSIYLGNVKSVKTSDGYMYVPDSDGKLHKALKEGYSSQEIVTSLKAQVVDGGIIVDGNVYGVGHSLTIRAGQAKIYLKISGIKPVA